MIQLKKILHPTDFSDTSVHSARYAFALADRFSAEVHLLHVVASLAETLPDISSGLIAHIDDYEELVRKLKADATLKMKDILKHYGCEHQEVVRAADAGSPFLQIIRYAKDNDIDLIVMGTHGRSGLSHLVMGSVAERVVRKAPCPVLSVPPKGHEFVMP